MINQIISYFIIIAPASYVTYKYYYIFKNTKSSQQLQEEADKKYDLYSSNIIKYIKARPFLLTINEKTINEDELDEIKDSFLCLFELQEDNDYHLYFDGLFKYHLENEKNKLINE